MSAPAPALLAAAAGVAFGHAILPDHWLPLALLGRTRGYPLARVARLSSLAGLTHVLVSLLLGIMIVVVGLQFRTAIQGDEDTIVGSILVLTGIAFVAMELSGHDHVHGGRPELHHGDHAQDRDPSLRGLAGVMVPFGAAASPDLTILPVFLAASAAGARTAIGTLLVFAVVTVATIMALTFLASVGGYRIRGLWLERWGNALTAIALIIIGALVLAGAI